MAALVVGVLLFIGLLLIGYGWSKSLSKQARYEAETRELKEHLAKIELVDEKQNAELKEQQLLNEQKMKKALASNHHQEALTNLSSLTNSLHRLLNELTAVRQRADNLATNDVGKRVAAEPDLLAVARPVYQIDLKNLPAPAQFENNLEAVRRVQHRIRQMESTTYAPPEDLEPTLQKHKAWTDARQGQIQTLSKRLDYLVDEVAVRLPDEGKAAKKVPLREAIGRYESRRAAQSAKEEQAIRDKGAEKLAQANRTILSLQQELKGLVSNHDIQKIIGTIELERLRVTLDLKEIEQEKIDLQLKAKAESREVQELLAPFLTPGFWKIDHIYGGVIDSVDAKPVSYSRLKSMGALARDTPGLEKLHSVASSQHDKMRPRWERDWAIQSWIYDDERRERLKKAQKCLIDLGPTLVRLEMLEK